LNPVESRGDAISHPTAHNNRRQAREADRFYGAFLIVLAAVSAAAPLFAESVLAWTLFLAGIAGVCWVALDRTPRSLLAAAGWTLVTLGLGFQLVFHDLLSLASLGLTLGLGFILLGAAEILFGFERYRRFPGARTLTVVGGAAAVAFGISAPIIWPDMPTWAGAATVAAMFATFGVSLIAGTIVHHHRRRRAAEQP
jgi:uncharacterized membrane protein HdeD (DUF308 family)